MAKISTAISKALTFFIRVYQYCISPFLGNHCRFYPSCSTYTIEAFDQHSLFKSFYLSIKRILSCHPLNKGGFDPVPENKHAK